MVLNTTYNITILQYYNITDLSEETRARHIGTRTNRHQDILALRQIGTFTDKSELWKIFNVFSCLFYI